MVDFLRGRPLSAALEALRRLTASDREDLSASDDSWEAGRHEPWFYQ